MELFAFVASLMFMAFGGWLTYTAFNESNGKMAMVGLAVFGIGLLGSATL